MAPPEDPRPLQDLLPLSDEQLHNLASRWIETDRELLAVLRESTWRDDLAEALGVARATMDEWRERLARALPPEESRHLLQGPLMAPGLGLFESDLAEFEHWLPLPPTLMAEPERPDRAELWPRTPEAGNQGSRGTCVAWAMSLEFSWVWQRSAEAAPGFSPQFAYWTYKHEIDRNNVPGTSFVAAIRAAVEFGICEADVWPYNPEPIPGNEGQDPPPPGATEAARPYRCRGVLSPEHDSKVERACRLLLGHGGFGARSVVIGVPVFPSWRNIETQRTGKIFMPSGREDPLGYHAMLIEGYRTDGSWGRAPGGGTFVVRNSWGKAWAGESPFKPGYALMPFDYIERYAHGLFALVTPEEARAVLAPSRPAEAAAHAPAPPHPAPEPVPVSTSAPASTPASLPPPATLSGPGPATTPRPPLGALLRRLRLPGGLVLVLVALWQLGALDWLWPSGGPPTSPAPGAAEWQAVKRAASEDHRAAVVRRFFDEVRRQLLAAAPALKTAGGTDALRLLVLELDDGPDLDLRPQLQAEVLAVGAAAGLQLVEGFEDLRRIDSALNQALQRGHRLDPESIPRPGGQLAFNAVMLGGVDYRRDLLGARLSARGIRIVDVETSRIVWSLAGTTDFRSGVTNAVLFIGGGSVLGSALVVLLSVWLRIRARARAKRRDAERLAARVEARDRERRRELVELLAQGRRALNEAALALDSRDPRGVSLNGLADRLASLEGAFRHAPAALLAGTLDPAAAQGRLEELDRLSQPLASSARRAAGVAGRLRDLAAADKTADLEGDLSSLGRLLSDLEEQLRDRQQVG